MKLAIKMAFAGLIFLFNANLIFAQGDVEADFEAIIKAERDAHFEKSNSASTLTQDYDVHYHRLEWQVDPAVFYIKGAVTTYFTPKIAGLQAVHFDLADELTVDSVLYHGNAISFSTPEPEVLKIDLPAAINDQDSLTVYYQGVPPTSGFGSFIQDTHDNVPVIWTLSEPYGAKDWWPCKQILTDKIDSIDVFVRTPVAYRVASNGLLVSEQPDGADKIYHWQHRYPIPAYLIAIAVTNYAVFSDFVPINNGNDSIEVLNYVYPEDQAILETQSIRLIDMMELYNDLFGLYPFAGEKYGHAQFGWGGGMEHQTMSFMGSFSHSLLSHELAHQWFGDKVTCGSWQDIWLNEGFATYLTALYWEAFNQPTWEAFKSNRINSVTNLPDGSVFVTDTTDVSRIFNGRLSYSKGALLLHMLRWKLGDTDFFQACRNYLDDPDLAFGYAVTSDLKSHMEAQSGQDLNEFFDDWFYGEGHPRYDITWGQAGAAVDLTVSQITSHVSVDFFEMPIPIQFIGVADDSIVVFDHSFSGQQFAVDLPFDVESVVFDPELWIISRDNTVNASTPVIDVQDIANGITVFPNPTSGEVTIRLSDNHLNFNYVDLLNSLGQQLMREKLINHQHVLDLDHLRKGIYFLQFTSNDGQVVIRKISIF